MKVALTVLKWVGFGFSIIATLGSLSFITTAWIPIVGLFPLFLLVYGLIVNIKAIFKHYKEKRSIKWGVLQIITLTGIIPGVIMIVATSLAKKQAEKELLEMLDTAEEITEAIVEDVDNTIEAIIE